MIPADINAELTPYLVRWPYVSNQAYDEPDGNAILYQGVYLAIKRRYFDITKDDAAWVRATYADAKHSDGVLTRGSHKKLDWQAHDDYIGMLYSSHITGEFTAALEIYEKGKASGWVFDNVGLSYPDKIRAHFGLIPGFVATVKLAVRQKLNLIDQLYFAFAVCFNDGESGYQKAFVMLDLYKTQPYSYAILNYAHKRFENEVSKKYPDKMGGVFKIYYGARHLFTRWMQGRM